MAVKSFINSVFFFAVSCSTVTVTKCQAALKTLQTFPFFNPTCLCREPQLDQKCNSFRTFLFDHPCLFASRRGKSSHKFLSALVSLILPFRMWQTFFMFRLFNSYSYPHNGLSHATRTLITASKISQCHHKFERSIQKQILES